MGIIIMTSKLNEKLLAAVISGDLEQVRTLVGLGANVNYKSVDHGDTPLHYASTPEIARFLLDKKAKVTVKDKYGQTPLCCAVKKTAKLEIARVLVSAGSCTNVRMVGGITPLHYAPDVKMTEFLLENGAVVNASDGFGRTPLHSALFDGKGFEVVKTLISAGADINVTIGMYCNSLLHYSDSAEITRELLSLGMNVNIMTDRRMTPLHYAVKQMKRVSVVRELLKNGADVNAFDQERNTALAYAMRCHTKDFDVIEALLEHGANVNEIHFDYLNGRFSRILDTAVSLDMPCAKFIAKIYRLRWYDDRNRPFALDSDLPIEKLKDICEYIDGCNNEISCMKAEKIGSNLTLYDACHVTDRENIAGRALFISYRTLENEILRKFPIYCDIISSRIRPYLERGLLINAFRGLQLYSRPISEYQVTLNSDCLCMIAEFLTDDDLRNLLIVLQSSEPSYS